MFSGGGTKVSKFAQELDDLDELRKKTGGFGEKDDWGGFKPNDVCETCHMVHKKYIPCEEA